MRCLENGKSFPNIPEWGEIECILNKLTNDIGAVLTANEDETARGREIAKLLVNTHKNVNKVLHYSDSLDVALAQKRVENALLAEIPEVMPRELKFEPSDSPFPVWRMIMAVVAFVCIVALCLCVRLVVYLVRRKK